ncbi:MAG: S53 family peptidase [Solirubrobacterales bacterium]|nr:S53 family peptidase [Solirubrobacterales bacterium]MBV9680446.1 S53 family peptidase [Solirubrobacterales bacterium]
MSRRIVSTTLGAVVLAALVFVGGASGARSPRLRSVTGQSLGQKRLLEVDGVAAQGATPPTDAQCRASTTRPHPCYSPQEIRHAYGVDQLINRGEQGKGQTIVIIDSFGSPTITSDLKTFDAGYGLPDPPSFKVLAPLGSVPFDPNGPDEIGWAEETTLDVEWAHAMAPAASIVLLTSPVDETEGVQGLPEFDELINYALDHHLGKVISESWGATENTLFNPAGEKVISDFNRSYARAAAMGVTALASTGDNGVANLETDLSTIYPFPTVNFPASSPLVGAIGGTSLFADTSGNYESETVWNQGDAATGGGISQQFREPIYQAFLPRSVQRELGGARGIPDVSWNADPRTPILIYLSFLTPGYYVIGGTSEGSPAWAGVVADLDQLAGRGIGLLDPYAYALGASGRGFHDVTVGNNSLAGITGYSAVPGWDLATGWGSPNLAPVFGGFGALVRRQHSMRALVSRARK